MNRSLQKGTIFGFLSLFGIFFAQPTLAERPVRETEEKGSYSAPSLAGLIRAEIRREIAEPIELKNPSTQHGEQCGDVGNRLDGSLISQHPNAQRGRLENRTAYSLAQGPSGSGQYWAHLIVVSDGLHHIGTCIGAKTAGFRSIPTTSLRHLPSRKPFQNGRLVIWKEVVVGAAETESLLLPVVYRLQNNSLVVDTKSLPALFKKFGASYRLIAQSPQDDHASMHRAAARAYNIVAASYQ